jgi:hypothetical protein
MQGCRIKSNPGMRLLLPPPLLLLHAGCSGTPTTQE